MARPKATSSKFRGNVAILSLRLSRIIVPFRKPVAYLAFRVQSNFAVDASANEGYQDAVSIPHADFSVKQQDSQQDRQALFQIGADSHGKSTGEFVGVQGGNTNEPVTAQNSRRYPGGSCTSNAHWRDNHATRYAEVEFTISYSWRQQLPKP